MTLVDEQLARWAEVGQRIGRARENIRPRRSKRAAAKVAGISEAQWRHIEAGRRVVGGVQIPPAVSHQVLEDAARSVNLDPAPLFEELGWAYAPGDKTTTIYVDTNVLVRLSSLEESQAEMKEELDEVREAVTRLLSTLGSEDAEDS